MKALPVKKTNKSGIPESKEMSFCHKLRFSYCYIFLIQCRRPLIFQIMISVRSNILSLKFPRFKPSGCRDIGIRTFKFLGKTQLLSTVKSEIMENNRAEKFLLRTLNFIKKRFILHCVL